MKKIYFSLLLVLCALFLLSCSNINNGEGIEKYTVVYPDSMGIYAEKFTKEKYTALRLQNLLSENYGIELDVQSDAEAKRDNEIIIGNAREYENKIDKYDYTVQSKGKNIHISAGSVYAYTKALNALIAQVQGEDLRLPDKIDLSEDSTILNHTNKDFVYLNNSEDKEANDTLPVKKLTIGGVDISKYKIIYHKWGYYSIGLNEEYAAEQLQKYIKLATGIELPLESDESNASEHEIVVGITNREGKEIETIDRNDYGKETLLIKTEGSRLILTGAEQRGTIYAVYTFLEKYLGYRFYTEDCEIIYQADSIDIPLEIFDEQLSTMEYRDIFENTMHSAEISSKRKINSNIKRGMNYKQGGNFIFIGEFVHTMSTMFQLSDANTQPCLSDEEIYQKALEGVRTKLSQKPDGDVISVSQNDNYQYCGCTKCAKTNHEEGSNAGSLIRFINRLADDIKDDYPNVKIITLAYMFSLEPTKTAPGDNVIIMYCPIESCCACALNDPNCQKNISFKENLEGWLELTDNVYVWYYITEYIQKGQFPFMNFDAIYENYQFFNSIGVKGVFNQGCVEADSGEFGALRGYLLSLLMWDPDITREEYEREIHNFIDAYYGEASDIIEEYFTLLEFCSKDKHFTQYASASGIFKTEQLAVLKEELDNWWENIEDIDFSYPDTKNHLELLKNGYKVLRRFF